jgi:(p)ppGpp synthase/HD superfamily hydrolase
METERVPVEIQWSFSTTMSVKLLAKPENLFEQLKKSLPQESFELIEKAYDFAEEHYTGADHPVGKPYLQYASEIALRLSELFFDPTLAVAAFLYPPPPIKEQVWGEIKKRFPQQLELMEDIAPGAPGVEFLVGLFIRKAHGS